MADDLDTEHDDTYDPERPYGDASVEGWQPPDEREFRKLLADHRKKYPEEFCRESLFEAKTARAWQREITTKEPPAELFGPLWRKGELAVLFGAPGTGKSILAVQIAESIARGRPALTDNGKLKTESSENSSLSTFPYQLSIRTPARPVLYFDFERSPQQFDERYSCPSPIPGKLPVKYRFSPKLKIARIANMEIPEIFQGNFSAYFEHSLALTAETGGDKVIIIDNLEWLDIKTTSPAASIRRMRTLKRCCMMTGTSILVLQSSPPCLGGVAASRGRGGSSGLRIPNSMFRIFEPADSIFAIGNSTFAADIRYVKPLKSSSGCVRTGSGSDWVLSPGEVLTYQLGRTAGFKNSPPYAVVGLPQHWPCIARPERGVDAAVVQAADGVVLSPHSVQQVPQTEKSVNRQLPTADCFLGLTYLGPSAESDHLRDYAAEAEARHAAEADRLKRIRDPRRVVEMLMSPEYRRYLKGER